MTNNPPRFHHFVPAFLLRNFVGNDGLFQIDFETGHLSPVTPERAFGKRDYNSIENNIGQKDHATAERILSEFESSAAPAIQRCISGLSSQDDLLTLAAYFVIQMIRTPAHRMTIQSLIESQVLSSIRALERRGEIRDIPDSLKKHGDTLSELVEKGIVVINAKTPAYLSSFTNAPELIEIIYQMNMRVLFSKGTRSLVIGDDPAIVYDPNFSSKKGGGGLALPSVELTLPISPKATFFAAWKEDDEMPNSLSDADVYQLNRRQAYFAKRFLISSDNDQTLEKLRSRYKSCGIIPKTNQLESTDDSRSYIAGRRKFRNEISEINYKKLRPIARSFSKKSR
ncbi:MAG: DUF4238 domain-containing protein [Pseudomonadota bacterium]|nr:DUF4238 domain-containing protein [Pseudomonadota bacterium]